MDDTERAALLKKAGWTYDNGWRHDAERWDCYINGDYGGASFLVILAREGKGKLLHLAGRLIRTQVVWSGPLESGEDVAALLAFIRGFKHPTNAG